MQPLLSADKLNIKAVRRIVKRENKKNIYVLENPADNAALRFAGVRGGVSPSLYTTVFIYIYIFIIIIIYIVQIGCKICICIIRQCKTMQNMHLYTFLLKFFAGLLRTKNNELRVTKKKNGVYSAMCGGCVVRAEMR